MTNVVEIEGWMSKPLAWWKLAAAGAALVALVAIARVLGREATDPQAILAQIRGCHPYDEYAYFLICASAPTIFLPDTALDLIGATLYPLLLGALLCAIGASLGAIVPFLLARWLGREFVQPLVGDKLAAFDARVQRDGLMGIVVLRIVPILPFSVVSYAAGLTNVRIRDYMWATFLGTIPITFVYQWAFQQFGSAVFTGLAHPRFLHDANCAAVAIALVALASLAWRWRHRSRPS